MVSGLRRRAFNSSCPCCPEGTPVHVCANVKVWVSFAFEIVGFFWWKPSWHVKVLSYAGHSKYISQFCWNVNGNTLSKTVKRHILSGDEACRRAYAHCCTVRSVFLTSAQRGSRNRSTFFRKLPRRFYFTAAYQRSEANESSWQKRK